MKFSFLKKKIEKKCVSSAKEIITFEMSAHLIQRFLCFIEPPLFCEIFFLEKKKLNKKLFLQQKKFLLLKCPHT
jgi:hypothetical protein